MPAITVASLWEIFLKHRSITTDTRKITAGDIFFALRGPHFNANDFALQAIAMGAAYVVADDAALPEHPQILQCADVLTMLQELAGTYRRSLAIPVIGITGSNGKTTTKELVHAVLSTTYRTSTTQGNLNNHIGIPLTLLRIPQQAQIAVVEMGANHQQEIAGYCQYTRPDVGLITNCGKAHLEGFGGVEGVRKGKGELFDFLKAGNGHAFICADFDYFHEMAGSRQLHHITWYGTDEHLAVSGKVLQADPFLQVSITQGFETSFEINTQLVGDYNIYNILAAVAIGRHFKVKAADIKAAIENYHPDNSRSQLIKLNGNTIILDAYNANPSSMLAAIKNFAAMEVPDKILMLGAMAELGEASMQEHEAVVNLLTQFKWKEVVLVGGDFEKVSHPFHYFNNAEAAGKWWQQQHLQGATLLLKGSRSMAMEKVLSAVSNL